MSTATATISKPKAKRRFDLTFIIKASRPGLWATAAWFYLIPLGRRQVFGSAGFWLGLIYVTLPLGLIIYGWNDVADAEIDGFNPRKGTFLFGALGSRDQLARLPLQIALVQLVWGGHFVVFGRRESSDLVGRAGGVYRHLQLSALWPQEPASIRHTESGRISAGVRSQQLA